ncbi:MAG: DciA family protein [Pseudomonadota bacterium]|nr:DciA family protein [Pseudomonadota bacterium]|tara:strand:+ start:358 stop:624 length:267 start_codon:yes stop_codon:yes gene_type:complete
MKKISNFIPNKVIERKDNINRLDAVLNNILTESLRKNIKVINYSETTVTIECENSSVASVMKFERDRYIDIFKNNGMENIQDLKIKIK